VVQHGQCGEQTALHLVISKLDELKGNEIHADRLEKNLRGAFEAKFGSVEFWRVAARPMDGSLPTVEPIADLFATWVRTTHQYPAPRVPAGSRSSCARDFCRFGG
jgi:hypothetical protein